MTRLGLTRLGLTRLGLDQHLASKTNYQCVTGVNIHHIAFTHTPTVSTTNLYSYYKHYHSYENLYAYLSARHARSRAYMQYSLQALVSISRLGLIGQT